jgi:hypothetical protein
MGNTDSSQPNPTVARMRMQMDLKMVACAYGKMHKGCEKRLRAHMRALRKRIAQGATEAVRVESATCIRLQNERDGAFRMMHHINGLGDKLKAAAAISDTSRKMMQVTATLSRDGMLNPRAGLRVCERFTAAMENIDATEEATGGALDSHTHGAVDTRDIDGLVMQMHDELVLDGTIPGQDVDALFAHAEAGGGGGGDTKAPKQSQAEMDEALEKRLRRARAASSRREKREFVPFSCAGAGACTGADANAARPSRQEEPTVPLELLVLGGNDATNDLDPAPALPSVPAAATPGDSDADLAARLARLGRHGTGEE